MSASVSASTGAPPLRRAGAPPRAGHATAAARWGRGAKRLFPVEGQSLPKGPAASQKAFDAAADCYGAQKTTTTFEERLGLGGGDPDLAMLRVEAQDAVRGSSSTSKVGLAYAKADAQYLKAFAPTAASNLVGVSSLGTDFIHVKRYDDWRDRWPTKVKGTL